MILIARAPVRISLGGGGTDLPSYYERHGGLVVSTSINYYVYTILTPGWSDRLQIISADYRTFPPNTDCEESVWGGDLRLPQAIASYFHLRDGLTVFLASQIPPGTGLGSSGSVAVSMIKALAFWCGLDLGPTEVAELACYIEIERLEMPVGKHDQYAAAFGGLNCITFSRSGVAVEPLRVPVGTCEALERGLMLFFAGYSHQSSDILSRQKQASQQRDGETIRRLTAIKELALEIRASLEQGNLETFGDLLHRSWMEKRQLAEGVTTPFLDRCYEAARENGALGGQVTGAGGGGFMMFYCPVSRQIAVTEALESLGLQRLPLALEIQGMEVMQAMPWSRPQASGVLPFVSERQYGSEASILVAPAIG